MSDYHIVRGRVIDNQDPEKLGRVQVRFPWLGERAGQEASEWARVSRSLSHAGAGDWSLPDIDDEVIVGFEFGRRESPVVLGSVYSDERAAPSVGRDGDWNTSGKNNLRFVKTKAGHQLIFDDLEGKESVCLVDKFENTIQLDEQAIGIRSQNGETITLDNQGAAIQAQTTKGDKIRLCDGVITLEAASGSRIEISDGGIKIESTKDVTVSGNSGIKLGEGAMENLVKGKLFMQLFNAHSHSTPVGPSSPPVTPMTPAMLSTKVKTE